MTASGSRRIFVAGHQGMVGSAIVRALECRGASMILKRTRADLDLTDQASVRAFFSSERPEEVYLAAARVGGIQANSDWPADFLYDNLMIEANVIDGAFRSGTRRLLFLGSSCIYPRLAQQPMTEKALLTGTLEPTNEPYAIAKIAGLKLCESFNRQYRDRGIDFRSVMPTNLYGSGDNYHAQTSHVIPSLLRRIHEAKLHRHPSVMIWGSGTPRREFLYVDDLADACLHVMQLDKETYDACTEPMLGHLNVGTGSDITILELARMICEVVGYKGRLELDPSKPDGTPRKLLDIAKIQSLGWSPKVDLEVGLRLTYSDFLASTTLRR